VYKNEWELSKRSCILFHDVSRLFQNTSINSLAFGSRRVKDLAAVLIRAG